MSDSNTDDQQLVSIKRPESGLTAIFEDMYLNERLIDVTLSCSDGQLHAHKLVLAAHSQYFGGVFDKLAQPFHYPVVVMKDMKIEDLKIMVDFMYKGQMTVSRDRLRSVIKAAENLQIVGLSDLDESICSTVVADHQLNGGVAPVINVEGPRLMMASASSLHHQKSSSSRRAKRFNSNLSNQSLFERAYHGTNNSHLSNTTGRSSPDRLLEQSLITGESLEGNQQFDYSNHNHSPRNLTSNQQHNLHASTLQLQNAVAIHQHPHQHQLQVLSHSLTTNRGSSNAHTSTLNGQANNNDNNSSQSSSSNGQPIRSRVHPCHICWKTFRERANLKRHLQVHSLDRVMYACIDCNKTFSWKDNYIRHTKTAHHMNNARQQT